MLMKNDQMQPILSENQLVINPVIRWLVQLRGDVWWAKPKVKINMSMGMGAGEGPSLQ